MSNGIWDNWEEELYATKKRLSAEIEGMTPEEQSAYLHAKAEPIMKQYNMKWAALKPVEPYHPREWQNVAAIHNS